MANFKIGLDAEFIFKNRTNGQLVAASHALGGSNTTAKFGTDGCSAVAEIRPNPAEHPVEMVENIRKVFQRKLTTTR